MLTIFELPSVVDKLELMMNRAHERIQLLENLMIDLPTLLTDIATLKTDIETLIADQKTGGPVDLQPAADAIAAIDIAVKAAIPPAPVAPVAKP